MGIVGRRGEVWIVEMNGKRRPAVVVNQDTIAEVDRILAKITSQAPRNTYDVELTSWKEAGLEKPSVVRCAKLNNVLYSDLIYKIGRLTAEDLDKVLSRIRDIFSE